MLAFERQDAIAAARRLASVGTGIACVLIAIIANFAGINSTVAADLNSALPVAAVTDLKGAIIAGFASVDPTVTASLQATSIIATIAHSLIAVIAGFPIVLDTITADLAQTLA